VERTGDESLQHHPVLKLAAVKNADRMRWNGVLSSDVMTRCNALLSRGIKNDRSSSYTGIPLKPRGTAQSRTK